jgi:hypothetical protein
MALKNVILSFTGRFQFSQAVKRRARRRRDTVLFMPVPAGATGGVTLAHKELRNMFMRLPPQAVSIPERRVYGKRH